MAGHFELIDAPEGGYRVALVDGDGYLLAISVTFPTERAAVRGISAVREIAGTGLISDLRHGKRPAGQAGQRPKLHLVPQPARRRDGLRSAAGQ